MSDPNKYLQIMLRFVREGGDVALSFMENSQHSFKTDKTIVTQADKAISRLAHDLLKDVLREPGHILIDEEDPAIAGYLDQKKLESTEYIFAVDPIDGTRLYANSLPTFGISIGLLKNLRPWLGVVYFPVLKELFYCDGQDSYYVKNAFTKEEKKRKIVPVDEEISAKSLFYCNDTFFRRFTLNDPAFHILIQACAVVNLLWPTIGRGVGCFLRSSLWDYAGSWPILRSAGMDLRAAESGKVMEKIDADLFNREPKPWELKEYYLISSARNYGIIKSKLVEISRK
jgi:fructose-1,6-bisphosphatase/inositol monophosphatase family enzyme